MSMLFESAFSIVIACVVVVTLVITIVQAMKRLVRRSIWHKVTVTVVNIMASVAILGLMFGIYYSSNTPTTLVLLTENTTEQVITNVKSEYGEGNLQWVSLLAANPSNTQNVVEGIAPVSINHISQLSLYYSSFSELIVVGDGLNSEQWQILESNYRNDGQFPFTLAHKGYTKRLGFINMHWQQQLLVGQHGVVSGQLQAPQSSSDELYTLSLFDPMNTMIDSQVIKPNDVFSFTFTANFPGQWLYRLELTKRGEALSSVTEKVSVQVTNAAPVRLLVKQSSPSFETRHLQNTITEQGGKVLTLTKISKNKDIRQQINIDVTETALLSDAFSSAALGFFDLLIIDQQALIDLTNTEQITLKQAIKNGLGVMVRVNAKHIEDWPNSSIDWLNNINVSATSTSTDTQAPDYLRWQYQNLDIPISTVNANIEGTQTTPLVFAQNNRDVVLKHEYGLGQVAVSLVNTSYIWKTQGKADLHSHYWQWIFSQVGRSSELPAWRVQPITQAILAHHMQQHCLVNAQNITQVDVQASASIAVNINRPLIDPNMACVFYAAPGKGWYSLVALPQSQNTKATTVALYANPTNSWQAWQQHQKYAATTNVVRQQTQLNQHSSERKIQINPYWFWLLLILSLSILWIERKYFS